MVSQRPYASEYSRSPGGDSELRMDGDNELACSCGEVKFIVTLRPDTDLRLLDSVECPTCHTVYRRDDIHAARE